MESNLLNFGTGPRGMSAVLGLTGRICCGDFVSRPKTAFNCVIAELG